MTYDAVRVTKFDNISLTILDVLMFGFFSHLVKQYFQIMKYLLQAYGLPFGLILL